MRDPTRRAVFAIALAVFALHLTFAARYGWFRDELYYVACARRLAWGYVDHPPLVAVIARIALALFGESLVGLRAFAALAAAGTALLAAEIARAMGGARFAQMLAAFAMAVAPYDLAIGQIYTMNSFEPLVWSGLALVVTRFFALSDGTDGGGDGSRAIDRSLLLIGPIVGLGILNKHSAAWPAIGLVIGIALSPSRRLLLRREILISVAIVILLVGPHVLWQVQNGFPTREFARNALSGKNEPYGPLGFLWQQVQLMHPLAAPLWIGGLTALLVRSRLRPFRPLAVAYLFVAVLIVATQAKAYYLGPAYGFLFAAGAVAFEELTRMRMQSARIVFPTLLAMGSAALLPMTIPVLSETSFQRYFAFLGGFGEAKSGEKQKRSALPQLYADMHGWPAMAARIVDVVDALPADERSSYAVLASNYGEASAVDMFGRARGVTNVASGNNGWWLWGPPLSNNNGGAGWPRVVVTIGFTADDLEPFFEDVRIAGHHDDPFARADERDLTIFVCHAPRIPMSEAWPRMKRFR